MDWRVHYGGKIRFLMSEYPVFKVITEAPSQFEKYTEIKVSVNALTEDVKGRGGF